MKKLILLTIIGVVSFSSYFLAEAMSTVEYSAVENRDAQAVVVPTDTITTTIVKEDYCPITIFDRCEKCVWDRDGLRSCEVCYWKVYK